MSKKAFIIGAGGTGRGFAARLLQENGVEVCFTDKNAELIDQLTAAKSYHICYGTERSDTVISGYKALRMDDPAAAEAAAEADWIFTSIGEGHLTETVPFFAEVSSKADHKLKVITLENGVSPKTTLRNAFADAAESGRAVDADVTQAAIFCTSIPQNKGELDILSENYNELPYDSGEKLFEIDLERFRPVDAFPVLLMRKIYTYNCLSGVIAYLGAYKGYTIYGEAANDPDVYRACLALCDGLNNAVCRETGVGQEEQKIFAQNALKKFCNLNIVDTIYKNARDASRKLGPTERIIGPMAIMLKYGEDTSVLEETAAKAMIYMDRNEKPVFKGVEYPDSATLLKEVNPGLDEKAYSRILQIYEDLKKQ